MLIGGKYFIGERLPKLIELKLDGDNRCSDEPLPDIHPMIVIILHQTQDYRQHNHRGSKRLTVKIFFDNVVYVKHRLLLLPSVQRLSIMSSSRLSWPRFHEWSLNLDS